MEFSSSFKNSFKSHMRGRRIYAGSVTEDDAKYENQPILSDHRRESSDSAAHHHMPGSSGVIVKIDGGSDRPATTTTPGKKNIWRESSMEFWGEGGDGSMQKGGVSFGEEPPLKLIGQFLNKQKAAGGETSLDMDLEMDELRRDNQSNNRTVPLNCSSFKDHNNRV